MVEGLLLGVGRHVDPNEIPSVPEKLVLQAVITPRLFTSFCLSMQKANAKGVFSRRAASCVNLSSSRPGILPSLNLLLNQN